MAGRPKGTKKTGGRPPGARNKITKDIKELAQVYGAEAVAGLAAIMRDAEAPHAARVSAMKEILDRAYGKSLQTTDIKSTDGSMTPKGLGDFYASLIRSDSRADA